MHIVTIASQKGGAGKTTIAAHLGVLAGGQGVLIDADPQRSLTSWWNRRGADMPVLVEGHGQDLAGIVHAASEAGSEWVFIDMPPHRQATIAEAMRHAELVVIPVRPSPFDLDAVPDTLAMATALRRPAVVVLNACPPPRGVGEAAVVTEARAVLKDMGADVLATSVGDRADYRHAVITGQSVVEFAPGGKAAREINRLWDEIRGRLASWQSAQASRTSLPRNRVQRR